MLRVDLFENRWMGRVEGPLMAIFNELLARAQKHRPADRVLGAIGPSPKVSAAALVMVVDQILVALDQDYVGRSSLVLPYGRDN